MKRFLCFLFTFCMLFSFSSCKKNAEEKHPSSVSEDDTSVLPSHTPAELDTTDYRSLCLSYFSDVPVALASDFTYEINLEKVTLLSYHGSLSRLQLPTKIDGYDVVAVSANLFENAENISVLIIPDSVTGITKGALDGCSNLYALSFPLPAEQNFYFGSLFGANSYEQNNQADLRNLEFLRITGNAEKVPANCFYGCNRLVAVELSEKITSIEKLAFSTCEKLKYINLSHVENFAEYAFLNAFSLQILTLCENLSTVGLGAFEGCDKIQVLNLPFVGKSKTESCYLSYIFGAKTAEFFSMFYPADLLSVTVTGTDAIADYAFWNCSTLKNLTLTEGVPSIGVRALSGCSSLEAFTIPNSVTVIRENAFFGCSSLSSLTFGSGLTELGVNAFYSCSSLESVSLPKTLTVLPNSCFAGCSKLSSIDLCNVTSVGDMAFRGCNSVTNATCNSIPTFGKGNEAVKNLLSKS